MKFITFFIGLILLSQALYAQCFEKYHTEGVKNYNEGNYSKAIELFNKALKCSDVPSGNDIDEWVKNAHDQIEQISNQKKKECFEINIKSGENAYDNKNYKVALNYFNLSKECNYEFDSDADYWIKNTKQYIPEIVFEDTYDDNKNAWGLWDDKEYSTEIREGKYKIEYKSPTGRFFWKSITNINNTNFAIETKIRCTKFTSNSTFCIIWGTKDNINFYALKFQPKNSEFQISGEENKIAFTYNSSLKSEEFKKEIASNTFSIKKIDSLIGFYINGKNEYTAKIKKIFGDKIGFLVYDTTTIEVEYLKVYRPVQTEQEEIKKIYLENINKYDDIGSFSEGSVYVKKDSKYGFVDWNGKVVIPFIYDNAFSFSQGRARVKKDGKCGFLDVYGKVVVPIIYEYANDFIEDRASVTKDGKYGFVDLNGKIQVPTIYDYACNFSEGSASVKKDGKYGFVDVNGKVQVPIIYDDAISFSEGRASVKKDGKYGFVEVSGKVQVPIIYDDAISFSEGRALVKKNSKYGFIDVNGKVQVPIIYDDAISFSEGRASVKKDGKYGFVDVIGQLQIPLIYDDAISFSEGIAYVKEDGKYGFINVNGKVVIPFI